MIDSFVALRTLHSNGLGLHHFLNNYYYVMLILIIGNNPMLKGPLILPRHFGTTSQISLFLFVRHCTLLKLKLICWTPYSWSQYCIHFGSIKIVRWLRIYLNPTHLGPRINKFHFYFYIIFSNSSLALSVKIKSWGNLIKVPEGFKWFGGLVHKKYIKICSCR